MRCTYRTLNDYEMQHNAEVGLFTRPSSLMNIRRNYAEINGIRLHYVNAGQGKFIMFVHDFPQFGVNWKIIS